jgi:preprotein translocase subunit YajC
MNTIALLLTSGTTNKTGADILSLLPMILIIGVMIVFMVISSRKQKKQDQEIANMRNNLNVGDEITTIGGIIGKVVSIKEETCVIETSRDGTKIRILKSAVSRVDVKAEDSID